MRVMSLRNEAIEQGLTSKEYDLIIQEIGREPNYVELGIISAMWSEHCCYKSSRLHLKTLPTDSPLVVEGPGENAGVIDIGDGLVCTFKIESHNHPSFIEPFQGAATGVGGILRDIFTMGARPIAVLDSLHFGHPTHEKTSYLVHGVVSGIAGYGNCMGIPTVGGEVIFDDSYNGNNLVNAMAVGIAELKDLHKAVAKGVGNRILYLGSKTGKDGIHGATMASEEFGEGNEERRPTVQVGDPFMEKLLLEACMEMFQAKILVGIQDMGAAGIACSTFEMSSRGNHGMRITLDHVPLRAAGMTPWEIFLSESQERMLLVVEPSKVEAVMAIAKKWDIDCSDIGEVTDSGRVEAFHKTEKVVDLPVHPVAEGAPIYDRPWNEPKAKTETLSRDQLPEIDMAEAIRVLNASPNLSSRHWVYRQYDHMVGTDTVIRPGGDAAVLRIKGRKKGLAVTVDSQSRYCHADPYLGTCHVMSEALRNLAVVGARGVAITNCLNFGNPEDPNIMGQIVAAIRAMKETCVKFDTPVTGGNVSLYNQTGDQAIKPTPAIGMIGLVEDVNEIRRSHFPKEGLNVARIGGKNESTLFQSEFASTVLKKKDLACPPIDLDQEIRLRDFLLESIPSRIFSSAHDCSDGGLGQAVLESCLGPQGKLVGVTIQIPEEESPTLFWFGETAGRCVVSYDPKLQDEVKRLAEKYALDFTEIGVTGGDRLKVGEKVDLSLKDLENEREVFFKEI